MTINIIGRSKEGVIVASDGYSILDKNRSSGTVKKVYRTNPRTISTATGVNGFISREQVKSGTSEKDIRADLKFRDLHSTVASDDFRSPLDTSRQLKTNTKKLVHFGATSKTLAKATGCKPSSKDILNVTLTGYNDNNEFELIGLPLPSGKDHRRYYLHENEYIVSGSGIHSLNRLLAILDNNNGKRNLVNFIKNTVSDKKQRNFLKLIKNYSKEHGFKFIFDFKLATQEKYFRALVELLIFLDRNLSKILSDVPAPVITLGGMIQSSSVPA